MGYEGGVVIPGLKQEVAQYSRERFVEPFVLKSTARGEEQIFHVNKQAKIFLVTFDIMPGQQNGSYVCQIRDSANHVHAVIDVPKAETVNLELPTSHYPAGDYALVLRRSGQDSTDVATYPFTLRYD